MTFGVGPDDDSWHAGDGDDPFWTETLWFGFAVPERKVTGVISPVFRRNQRAAALGVYLWDAVDAPDGDGLYRHWMSHLPVPDDPRDLELPNGFAFRSIEPLQTHEMRYDDGVERVELRYEASTSRWGDRRATPRVGSAVPRDRVAHAQRRRPRHRLFRGARAIVGGASERRSPPRPEDLSQAMGAADSYGASAQRRSSWAASVISRRPRHTPATPRDGELQRIVEVVAPSSADRPAATLRRSRSRRRARRGASSAVGTCVNRMPGVPSTSAG
jgi:hypothetical protein